MMTTVTQTAKVIGILFLLSASALASDYDKLIPIVSKVESNGRTNVIGDSGLARGEFQLHKPAWEQVSQARKARGEVTYSWDYAHDPVIGRQYAKEYLTWLDKTLSKRLGRPALNWEIYASYNRGLGGFAKLGFCFENLPAHTQRSCRLIAQSFGEPI